VRNVVQFFPRTALQEDLDVMTKPVHVMVVTPHPDDAEFGVAGTVCRWTAEGKDVIYVVCTNGDKGTSDPNMKPEELASIREQEQLAASKLLGVREVIFLRHPDQTLEDTPEFRKEIVRLIRTYKPETVVTADPYRRYIWHRDHRITGQVTLDAIFPYARDFLSFPDLLEEGLQPHRVKEVLLWGAQEPNYRTDITATFATKVAALRCHKSQTGDNPSEGLEERLRERHKMFAQDQDYELAEAFYRVEIQW
jgi:LmbE family N-acetylglucosaminyl deacetylase